MDDASTPDPPHPHPSNRVSAQDSNVVRFPNAADPDIDEQSTVSDIIAYGHHSMDWGGKGSRAEWLWRRRLFKALHYLRLNGLYGKAYADAAESIGVRSRSELFKLAHLWSEIEDVDAFAHARANESMRRRGIEEWPTNNALLKKFPSLPGKASSRSKEEKDEEEAEEAAARKRAKGKRNSVGGDEELEDDEDAPALGALRSLLEQARRDLEFERAGREAAERTLARERQLSEALGQTQQETPPSQKPQVPPEESWLEDSRLLAAVRPVRLAVRR